MAWRFPVPARRCLQIARPGGAASGARDDGHSGVGTSASARWSSNMQKFKERTKQNIPSITKLRLSQDAPFRRPRGLNLAPRRAGPAEPLARKTYDCVAFLGDVQDVRALHVARGSHRCLSADLVVVPDLGALHERPPTCDYEDWAVCVLYIVARGVDVTTVALLRASGGFLSRLSNDSVTSHLPASEAVKASISVSRALREQFSTMAKALKYVCAPKSSLWSTPQGNAAASGAGAKNFQTLDELVAWVLSLRMVQPSIGPKVRALDGRRMPV